jgi:hypothetical protein
MFSLILIYCPATCHTTQTCINRKRKKKEEGTGLEQGQVLKEGDRQSLRKTTAEVLKSWGGDALVHVYVCMYMYGQTSLASLHV